MQNDKPTSGFDGLGIAPSLLKALDYLKFTVPTPIQLKSIPAAIEGKDLIGIAQTGTGKTLAFGIPMLQRLAQVKGRGLVLLPTRELALQVEESLHKFGRSVGLRTVVLIGGASMNVQIKDMRKNPHIIIATPGRLIDHLNQRTFNLHDVKILVLDEADRMLDMGFAPQINKILTAIPPDRQTMLFSATMPDDIVRIATKHMKLPLRIEVARAGTASERVEQELFVVKKEEKTRLLNKLLDQYHGPVLVFSRTKFGAKKIARAVGAMYHKAAEIHSNRSLNQRREALDGFKSGKYRVLVATDIAARGIDVTGIELVVNFDLPENAEDYVHRIGRTGRAGHAGRAISFACPDQRSEVRDIERLMRINLQISQLPELPAELKLAPLPREASYEARERQGQSRGARPPYGGRGGRPAAGGGHASGGGRSFGNRRYGR